MMDIINTCCMIYDSNKGVAIKSDFHQPVPCIYVCDHTVTPL